MILVCSGFNSSGYAEYGKNFLSTFDKHWPVEVGLRVYAEARVDAPRRSWRNLWHCAGVAEFIEKYGATAKYCGREVMPGWGVKDRERKYCYRYDAVKFCRQLFIPEQVIIEGLASGTLRQGDILVWLDADVVTFKDVPLDFIPGLLKDYDACYLGRQKLHSEIGFWAVRINPQTRAFVSSLADMYRKGEVFKLQEWHSAFVWDHCRVKHSDMVRFLNLTPGGYGHVWWRSPLKEYTDHLKGDSRKQRGKSLERV